MGVFKGLYELRFLLGERGSMVSHVIFLLYFGVLSFINIVLLDYFHVLKQLGIIAYPVVIILVFLEMVLIGKIAERSWTKKNGKKDGGGTVAK